MNNSLERKYTLRIFKQILLLLVIHPMLVQYISTTVIGTLSLLFLLVILQSFFKMYYSGLIKCFTGNLQKLYVLFAVISLFIIVRGNWPLSSAKDFLLLLINRQTLCFILPPIIIMLPAYKYMNELSIYFYYASLITVILWIISPVPLITDPGTAEGIGAYMPFFAFFSMAFSKSKQLKRNIIMCGIIVAYILLMLLNARRNMVFSLVGLSFVLYYSKVIHGSVSSITKVSSLFVLLLASLYLLMNYQSLATGTFSAFAERMSVDTRSGYNEMLLADFAVSPWTDWIFGRGMSGSFYLPWNDANGIEYSQRQGIETGYLNMLLKGGILYIVVVVLFMMTALKRTKRHNKFLFLSLFVFAVDMYATCAINNMSSKMILFWMTISLCITMPYSNTNYRNETK